MAEQKHMQLLAPNNHIKNTSTCGVLLTKSKLKLAEKLLYSQGYREKHTKSGLKGREEGRSGSTSLGGRHRERGITQAQRPSLGNEQLKPRVGHSKPGANPSRASSLNTFENQLQTGSRAKKNLHSARKGCSHAYLIMEQGRPSMLKLPGTLTGIPQLPQCTC